MRSLTRSLLAALLLCALITPSGAAAISQPSHKIVGAIEISKDAGLGRLEIHGKTAAVLQRDEGIVAMVDISDPRRPKVVGSYDDGATQSLDGDLAFSTDGKWLFYARQTVQFSRDGVHVLNVSNPKQPTLASYQPGGGTLRIAHYDDGTTEWVVVMDATTGMVVYRFEPTTGVLVPVHVNALPALKVGGPASAGIVIQKDPLTKKPLLYATTGETGLEIFDFSDPTSPVFLGSWAGMGLAEVEVNVVHGRRLVYAAAEYWFEKTNKPVVIELDATKLNSIKQLRLMSVGCGTDDSQRVQGMALAGNDLYVANSTIGLPVYFGANSFRFAPVHVGTQNPNAGYLGDFYVFDVEVAGKYIYATDAANGFLTTIERGSVEPWSYSREEVPWHSWDRVKKFC
jgi:hypothetical protein